MYLSIYLYYYSVNVYAYLYLLCVHVNIHTCIFISIYLYFIFVSTSIPMSEFIPVYTHIKMSICCCLQYPPLILLQYYMNTCGYDRLILCFLRIYKNTKIYGKPKQPTAGGSRKEQEPRVSRVCATGRIHGQPGVREADP